MDLPKASLEIDPAESEDRSRPGRESPLFPARPRKGEKTDPVRKNVNDKGGKRYGKGGPSVGVKEKPAMRLLDKSPGEKGNDMAVGSGDIGIDSDSGTGSLNALRREGLGAPTPQTRTSLLDASLFEWHTPIRAKGKKRTPAR